MGLFSFLKKKSNEEIFDSINWNIARSCIRYSENFKCDNQNLGVFAGEELVYLLLHLSDRIIQNTFDLSKRDEIFEKITVGVIYNYSIVFIKKENRNKETIKQEMVKMWNKLQIRQDVYNECASIFGESENGSTLIPHAGTVIFAFSFYIYKSQGRTNRDDIDEILTGEVDISDEDLKYFPDPPELLERSIEVATFFKSLEEIKKLKFT